MKCSNSAGSFQAAILCMQPERLGEFSGHKLYDKHILICIIDQEIQETAKFELCFRKHGILYHRNIYAVESAIFMGSGYTNMTAICSVIICSKRQEGEYMVFDLFKKHNNAKKKKYFESIGLNSGKNKNSESTLDGMNFSAAVVSDVGCLRENNEDNYILGKYMNIHSSDHSEITLSISDNIGTWQFAGVFDGMGGGEMGELASHETATIFMNALDTLNKSPSKTEVDRCIRNAFLQSNNRIVDFQKEHKIFGTTGTLLCYNGLEYKLYHLGDSRAYLIRGNEIIQLTKDQTLAQMKIEVGMYQEDDPAAEADKHKLTEYIGRDWTRENIKPVESHWLPAAQGDSILLCSDGLYDMCTNDEIINIMSGKQSAGEKATALVKEACAKGGDDNVTCIVILIS